MSWISVKDRLPAPHTKVWLITDSGKRTTGYRKPNGEWVILCRKIAAEKPEIVSWEEN